mgnify:FL=1
MSKLRDHYLFHAGISCFFYLGYGAFTVVLSMYCQDIGMSASQIAYIVSFAPLLLQLNHFLDTWQISGNHQEKYLFYYHLQILFACLFLQLVVIFGFYFYHQV